MIVALVAVYLAFFYNWKPYLSPGELGTIIIVAADRQQALVILRYIKGFVEHIPFFRSEKTRDTATALEFRRRRIAIEVHTTSFRATRGYTIVAALLDEVAFWRSDETANPDEEVLNAIRPGMATIPGAMLLAASSPYSKRGILFNMHRDYFGKDSDDVLVWHGDTRSMNPRISQKYLDRQYDKDAARASAEYGAQFRADIEDFITEEIVDANVDAGVFERPYSPSHMHRAFCDPSGGSQDSFTWAIGHPEDGARWVDLLREVTAPFDPDEAVAECAADLKRYGILKVEGDNYAGNWPKAKFQKYGITYEPCGMRKSDIYRDALPILNSKGSRLIENRRLRTQILCLERKNGKGGKFSIDHPKGGKDDCANAVLGLIARMEARKVEFSDEHIIVADELSSFATDSLPQLGAM